ncbi:MAG: hypothetical protein HYY17_08110 [Planctomycetes bacterium]|nr:hypothetical protein [Planctomycetota bacterium]
MNRTLALGAAGLVVAAVAFAVLTRGSSAATPAAPQQQESALEGKRVMVNLNHAYAPHEGFVCVYAFDGKVTGTSAHGLFLKPTKAGSTQFWRDRDGAAKPAEPVADYTSPLFIPWASIKYVKIAE